MKEAQKIKGGDFADHFMTRLENQYKNIANHIQHKKMLSSYSKVFTEFSKIVGYDKTFSQDYDEWYDYISDRKRWTRDKKYLDEFEKYIDANEKDITMLDAFYGL